MKISRGEFTKKLYIQSKSSWCSRGKMGFSVLCQVYSSAILSALTLLHCLSHQWKINHIWITEGGMADENIRKSLKPENSWDYLGRHVTLTRKCLSGTHLSVAPYTQFSRAALTSDNEKGQHRGADAPGRSSACLPLRLPSESSFRGSSSSLGLGTLFHSPEVHRRADEGCEDHIHKE